MYSNTKKRSAFLELDMILAEKSKRKRSKKSRKRRSYKKGRASRGYSLQKNA